MVISVWDLHVLPVCVGSYLITPVSGFKISSIALYDGRFSFMNIKKIIAKNFLVSPSIVLRRMR